MTPAVLCAPGAGVRGGAEALPALPGGMVTDVSRGTSHPLSSALAFIYRCKKIWPLSGLIFFSGHTSPTKHYFHGSATETEQNVLSFRSREHSPGHLLEDLQNTSREARVRATGKERPLPRPSLHGHQALVP